MEIFKFFEQAEVINQVVAGVRETFADTGLDQAVLIRSLSLVATCVSDKLVLILISLVLAENR